MSTFLLEAINRALLGRPVDTHVGYRVYPQRGCGLHRSELGQFQPGQEILLDVAHAILDAALLVAAAHVAGADLKAPVAGEIQILRIEHGRRADQALQYRRLEVVHHDATRHAPKGRKGVLVTGQKEFHRLRDGELQVQAPAMAQHHQKEAQASARRAHGDGAKFTPIDLGAFAGGEFKLEERFLAARSYAMHVVVDDRDPALIARLANSLEDLLPAVGMGIQPANDLPLIGIELAFARHAAALVELRNPGPLGHRARTQRECPCGLGDGEVLAIQVVVDLAESLVVNHGGAPSARTSAPGAPGRRCSRALAPVSVALARFGARLESQAATALGIAGLDRR